MKLDPQRAADALQIQADREREFTTSAPYPQEGRSEGVNASAPGVVGAPPDHARCTAFSERANGRCKRWAIRGTQTCPRHAESLEQSSISPGLGSVPGSAGGVEPEDSLDSLRGLAVSELRKLLRSKSTQDAVKVQAARAVRDLTGPAGTNDNYQELHEWRTLLSVLPVEDRLAYLRQVSGVGNPS